MHATKLTAELVVQSEKFVHPRTVQRALNDNGLHCRIQRKTCKEPKTPPGSAHKCRDKELDFWKQVLFTNEFKYNVFGNDGRARVEQRKAKIAMYPMQSVSSVEHGGVTDVMFRGAVGLT